MASRERARCTSVSAASQMATRFREEFEARLDVDVFSMLETVPVLKEKNKFRGGRGGGG